MCSMCLLWLIYLYLLQLNTLQKNITARGGDYSSCPVLQSPLLCPPPLCREQYRITGRLRPIDIADYLGDW